MHDPVNSIVGLVPHERPYWRLLLEMGLLGVLAVVTHVSNTRTWDRIERSASGLAMLKERSILAITEGGSSPSAAAHKAAAAHKPTKPAKRVGCWASFTSLCSDMAWLAMGFVYLVVLAVLCVRACGGGACPRVTTLPLTRVCISCRYVLGLSHVDLIHSVYMLLFVIMFTSPPIRRK